MYLTKLAKEVEWLKTLRVPEMRRLPLRTLWRIRRMLKDEKLVRVDGKVMINSFLPPVPSEAFRGLARGLHALTQGRAVPVSTYVAVTNACPYRCWHCSREFRVGSDMPLGTMLGAIRELQALGVSIIGLTGGEPLVRKDLEQIVAGIDERSVSILFTSGAGLTPGRARALKRAGLFGVAVSLDHYEPGIHDARRGRPGAFETALNAIRASKRMGFYTMLQLVATRDVIEGGSIPRYLALAQELGVHEIRVLEPMPAGRLLHGDPSCFLKPHERQELHRLHQRTNRSRRLPKVCAFAYVEDAGMFGCGAGFQHMYIDAAGNVCPCDFTPISFGNVRHESVQAVWQRLNEAFARPRRRCFLLENAAALRRQFDGTLPIPYEELKDSCRFRCRDGVPRYYRELGWRTEGGTRQKSKVEGSKVEGREAPCRGCEVDCFYCL